MAVLSREKSRLLKEKRDLIAESKQIQYERDTAVGNKVFWNSPSGYDKLKVTKKEGDVLDQALIRARDKVVHDDRVLSGKTYGNGGIFDIETQDKADSKEARNQTRINQINNTLDIKPSLEEEQKKEKKMKEDFRNKPNKTNLKK